MSESLNLGHLVEGVVEVEDGKCWIRTIGNDGKPQRIDVQELVSGLEGKVVRLVLTSFDDLERLSDMVRKQGNSAQLPEVPFNIAKRRS